MCVCDTHSDVDRDASVDEREGYEGVAVPGSQVERRELSSREREQLGTVGDEEMDLHTHTHTHTHTHHHTHTHTITHTHTQSHTHTPSHTQIHE